MDFLPMSKAELRDRGIEQPDFVLVTGDAYVDHPSFGAAIIGRLLEQKGFSVGMIAQPGWKDVESFKTFGLPRLGFLVTGGNIDSMVNHYSVSKKKRNKDLYSPGGEMGLRPDRATIVYGNKIREAYKNTAIILGGIEASLRRLSHYDYWDDAVRRSILLDSGADLLVYGMGEHQIVEIAEALDSGIPVEEITFIRGTVYKTRDIDRAGDYILLPAFQAVKEDKTLYGESFLIQYGNTDAITGKTLAEPYGNTYVVQNPPATAVSTSEFDSVYALPYMRTYHPVYEEKGGVPAINEVRFSIISNRGCFGSCNFCALAFHQGRVVQVRSHHSIVNEAKRLTWEPDFKGYIHDVGGPTANFRQPACQKQLTHGACSHRQCLFPEPCENLQVDHKDYLVLLKKLRHVPGVKKVFIRSGLRYDYLVHDRDPEFFNELCEYHISGQLKVAPEHISSKVLDLMGKPGKEVYDRFVKRYTEINQRLGKKQYIVPYMMSSHPGSDLAAAVELAEYLRELGHKPEQVQDFYPTPGTLSTCMYYTQKDPRTGKPVYVPKTSKEKAMQRALMQYHMPQNYHLVREALVKAGREDLIGFEKHSLIRPGKPGAHEKKHRIKTTASCHTPGEKPPKKKKTIRNIHKKKI